MANTWRDIADSEVDPESPVTTSLAQAWRDNPGGIAKAASGAPTIVYGALALSNDINQGDLKTTTGTVSHTEATDLTGSSARRTLPGGQWGFTPESGASGTGTSAHHTMAHIGLVDGIDIYDETSDVEIDAVWNAFTGTAGFASRIHLVAVKDGSDGSTTSEARQRYVQASPPYDLGDGECGLFIEADIKPGGSLAGLYIAPDPIWANNGPTIIRPDYIDRTTGKGYKRVRRPQLTRADLDAGRCDLADYIAAQKEAPVEDVEVTHALKNADMDVIPHSWASPPQGTICLLDPVNTFDLLMLHDEGEDVAELMHKGYIRIGDEVKRKGPPGVVPVTFKWRNSR